MIILLFVLGLWSITSDLIAVTVNIRPDTTLSSTTKIVSLETVWTYRNSGKPHNAFTDMIRFKDQWYIGCREALKHHGGLDGMGELRVLCSPDGSQWASVSHFVLKDGDLRDAKLCITGDGELMLHTAIQVYKPDPVKHKNFAWFSKDGRTWSEAIQFGEPDFWIWSITWNKGTAYGVGYPTTKNAMTRLYKSNDGRQWKVLVEEFHSGNESAIAFKSDGTAVCYMRSGNAIGQAKPPYTNWSWKTTINLGGPDLICLPDGRFIAGGREGGWGTMKLFEIDPETGSSTHLIDLPARGDSSYPGLVYYKDLLWVSYYSSSEDAKEGDRYLVPTEIRLAKVKLGKKSHP